MSNSIKRMFLAIAALVISVAASAQVTTSAISGKITDKDGAVAAVPVVATHVPSGTIYYSITVQQVPTASTTSLLVVLTPLLWRCSVTARLSTLASMPTLTRL